MPRRRWGQHFLRSDATAERLVALAGVGAGESVLEVGPGSGRLTRALLARGCRVVAVEIDPRLAESLPRSVPDASRLRVVAADAATVDLDGVLATALASREPVRVVASLPYESATAILLRLLDCLRIGDIAVVVQREVAERIAAAPGTAPYGYLSAVCQDLARPAVLIRLPPGAFRPVPRVDSALLRLARLPSPRRGAIPAESFRRFVGALFSRPRKTVRNNLRAARGLDAGAAEALLARAGVEGDRRPEELAVEALAPLWRAAEGPVG